MEQGNETCKFCDGNTYMGEVKMCLWEGEEVFISVMVTNQGDTSGSFKVILLQNDKEVDSQHITLYGGRSKKVIFKTTADKTGTCSFSVADNTFEILVEKPELPEELTEASEIPEAVSGLPLEDETPIPAEDKSNNTIRIWIVFGVLLAISCLLFWLLKKAPK